MSGAAVVGDKIMATTAQVRTPVHLWVIGILALLWNCFGAYDYVMSHMRDTHYIASSMPGVDPNAALAWMDAFPIYAKAGWALGVWGGLLGAILLLIRSRYAVWAFALSMLGIVLSIGWQIAMGPKLAGAEGAMYTVMPYVIIVIGIALLAYSNAMQKKGVLR
jgi:hypothetical protein